jgi:hypothetical protein
MKRLVGERRAIATAILAFWTLMWLGNALALPPPFQPVFYALTGVYGLAFWSVSAGYFWARWYASGVMMFGMILGAVGMVTQRFDTPYLFFFGIHFLATLSLWGESMSNLFDGRTEWREKLQLDEGAVTRLGNAITRVGVSLPMILIYALGPKPKSAIEMAAAGLAALALAGTIRMRTWGVLAAAGAGAMTAISVVDGVPSATAETWLPTAGAPIAIAAAVVMFAAAAPFFAAMGRFVRRDG